MNTEIKKHDVRELLAKSRIVVSPEIFSIISLTHSEWLDLLKYPELSPGIDSPFAIFKDSWEVTLIINERDYQPIKDQISGEKVERNFRMLSLDAELEFDVVGFMARIASLMADADISILPFSSFSRDHLFIRQDDLAKALNALRDHVEEVC